MGAAANSVAAPRAAAAGLRAHIVVRFHHIAVVVAVGLPCAISPSLVNVALSGRC
jgi:hypothetical protein